MTGVLGQIYQHGIIHSTEFAARNMLTNNEGLEKIILYTGIPLSRIEELKRDIDSEGA